MTLGPDDLTPKPGGAPTVVLTDQERIAVLERELNEFRRLFGRHREIEFLMLEDRVDEHERQLTELKRALTAVGGSVDRVLSHATKGVLNQDRMEAKLDRLLIAIAHRVALDPK